MELIHPNATFLLRPKTNLNDMVVEVDPGSGKKQVEDGTNFTLAQTEPNTNLDAFLATLDADTRQYLQLLLAGGAQGIGGRGRQLSNALRRFQPFVHYTAKLNKVVAQRHEALARVIHDFGLLTTELGRHDAEIQRFVTSSNAALGNFANQQQSIQETLGSSRRRCGRANAGLASSQPLLDRRPSRRCRADPAGAGARARLQGDREPLQPDDGPDPRPDPPLHPSNPAGPGPRQRRRAGR